jgi:Replication protein
VDQFTTSPPREHANNFAPPSQAGSRRRDRRYALRSLLWEFSQVKRCKGCGRWMTGSLVGVRYSAGNGAGFSGLQTCGSIWICPVCSSKILARRSVETGVLLLGWESQGGRMAMGTLTMRHNKGHSLRQEWDALGKAWASVIGSQVWRKWKQRVGSPGLVKVVEVTYGKNGWHVHLHFVLLVGASCTEADVDELTGWLIPKWQRSLAKVGMPGALDVGQELHFVEGVEAASQLGEYFAKQTAYGTAESLGRELFSSWTKGSLTWHSTVPVWRLIEEFASTGDLELLGLWHEFERVSHGRKQMAWSQGLRELMALGPEKSDEEIAAEEAGDRDLLVISREGWQGVLAAKWPACLILDVMERSGVDAVCRFLDANGIEHLEVHDHE